VAAAAVLSARFQAVQQWAHDVTADVLSTAGDLGVNLAASAIAAVAVVTAGRIRRSRRLGRLADFLGVGSSKTVLVVVPSHPASQSRVAVHRLDVATMIEVAALVREAGSGVELLFEGQGREIGNEAEICVAGPEANSRTAGHLRNFLPGLTFDPFVRTPSELTIRVGEHEFPRSEGRLEYVVLARLQRPSMLPTFLISGQTATANLAGARYLAANVRTLIKRHGSGGQFCLILRVVDSRTYGPGWTELVADYFVEASERPAGPPV
jgi:hypothetical protein